MTNYPEYPDVPKQARPAEPDWAASVQAGIPKPILNGIEYELQLRPDVMRTLIVHHVRDSKLIREVHTLALRTGLNTEDHMTVLAYMALRQLEDTTINFTRVLSKVTTPRT